MGDFICSLSFCYSSRICFALLSGLFDGVQQIIFDDIVKTVQFVYQLAMGQSQKIKGVWHQIKSVF